MKARKMATLSLAVTLALAGTWTLLWRLDAASHIAHANPDIRWVSDNCTGFPASPCYTSIQAAVNAASDWNIYTTTIDAHRAGSVIHVMEPSVSDDRVFPPTCKNCQSHLRWIDFVRSGDASACPSSCGISQAH